VKSASDALGVRAPKAPDWLLPDWSVERVGALMTTRHGGVSAGPFASFNLRASIGDDPAAVAANQHRLATVIGATPVWLNQVHGARVVRLTVADAAGHAPAHAADASITTAPGVACCVQVADCLPVLFAAANGRAVGAAHAGWRGLAAGVLETTLADLAQAADCATGDVHAWLGPCIGPTRFEVGADVLEAFGAVPLADSRGRFVPAAEGKWWADLAALAIDRLRAAGVREISGGAWCTASDASRFFSFRRDRITGRMAAAVWIEGDHLG
jgi:polyphenol oxidase